MTDVSSHSTADSRDKLHLTRHHPSMHRTSRSGQTPRLTMFTPCTHMVATYQVDLPVLNFSSWKVTFRQFPSFNCSFCARRINATLPFFCDLKRRNNATLPVLLRSFFPQQSCQWVTVRVSLKKKPLHTCGCSFSSNLSILGASDRHTCVYADNHVACFSCHT